MPVYIQNTFIKAFSKEVMCEDKMGITEKEWLQNLLRFQSEVIICPIAERKPDIPLKMQRVCAVISRSRTLAGSRHNISAFPIFPKQEIVTAYITDCYDQNECRTVTAKVVQK